MKVLLITAHPDDWETGIGGLVTQMARDGHTIISVIGTPGHENTPGKATPQMRLLEAAASHTLVGISNPRALSYTIDTKALSVTPETRKEFTQLVNDIDPNIVFTLSPMDAHHDHRNVAALAIEPCLHKGVNREIFVFEVCAGAGRPQTQGFHPAFYVDVSGEMEMKRQLMFCHESQNPGLHWEGIAEMASRRGEECAVSAAEGLVRLTRYGDPPPELLQYLIPSSINTSNRTGTTVVPENIGLPRAA